MEKPVDSALDRAHQKELVSKGTIPRHIAIIMDGNGRWAQERGLTRTEGHRAARLVVRDITRACGEIGVEYLSLFTFGTENWSRPWREVLSLMQLLRDASFEELIELHDNNVRLIATGNIERLAKQARLALYAAMERTKKNTGLTLNLSLSYDGRGDIVRAAQRIAKEAAKGKLKPTDIDADMISQNLFTCDLPDPDLLIRTSGELRLSNFMLWQCAYTEFFFTPVYWPAFERNHLYEAVASFQGRERRYGKTSAQVTSANGALGETNGASQPVQVHTV